MKTERTRFFNVNFSYSNCSKPKVTQTPSFQGWFSRKKKPPVTDVFVKSPISPEKNAISAEKTSLESQQSEKSVEKSAEINPSDGLNSEELIFSYKLADILHRLDDESIILIGDQYYSKDRVKDHLTKPDSFIQNPKNIKNVYVLNHYGRDYAYWIIAKNPNGEFSMFGPAINTKNIENNTLKYLKYSYKNVFDYGDVAELENNIKIKFIKTEKESNGILFDAKYPIESFLSKEDGIKGGVVINKSNGIKLFNDREKTALKLAEAEKVAENSCKKSALQQKKSMSAPIPKRTFADIAGMDDAIEIVKQKVLFPILYPSAFPEISNKGVILTGLPGTGKTLLAYALIGEAKKRKNADIHMVKIDAKSLDKSLVGQSEGLWREVFKECEENQPSILFIDEIDSVLRKRGEDSNFTHTNGIVSQFLTLIDNLEKNNSKVWILSATNNEEMIDPAIKRSGRLGNVIKIQPPNEKGCLDILNLYLKGKSVDEGFERGAFAEKLHNLNCTGADISVLVQNARDCMYERNGIYEKMDNNSFKNEDLFGLNYKTEDFEKALAELKKAE